jgi:hypothetical protein
VDLGIGQTEDVVEANILFLLEYEPLGRSEEGNYLGFGVSFASYYTYEILSSA